MISLTPNFTWRQIFFALYSKALADQALAFPWLKKNDYAFIFSKTAWSLQAIVFWWQETLHRTAPIIWVPAYFCDESLIPLRATSGNIVFYPIDDTFQPDWRACEDLAKTSSPDMFVLVHYFGMQADGLIAKKFCQRHHCLLIEDAAHVLQPVGDIGAFGDFVLYSPHKLLPLSDGAICVMRQATDNNIQAMKTIMQTVMAPTRHASWQWFFKKILRSLLPDRYYHPRLPDFIGAVRASLPKTPQPSWLSRKLLQQYLKDFTQILEKRRKMMNAWQFIFSMTNELKSLKIVSLSAMPYFALLKAKDKQQAEAKYEQLRQARYPISVWPHLPDEIENSDSYAKAIRQTTFTLPVHQSISITSMFQQYLKKSKQPCDYQIVWGIPQAEWEACFQTIPQSNLLQSWEYGEAKKIVEGWVIHRGQLMHHHKPIGLIQCLEKRFGFVRVVRINRGPLWLNPPTTEAVVHIYRILKNTYSFKNNCILFMAPELMYDSVPALALAFLNYRRKKSAGWQSAWLDLRQSEEALCLRLRGNWRNQMKRSEQQGLSYQVFFDAEHFQQVLDCYKTLQQQKKFSGISVPLLKALHTLNAHQVMTVQVHDKDAMIAAAIFFKHGQACTYLVGYNSEQGRQVNAMNFLLWRAIIDMKQQAIAWFDVGGIEDEKHPSISKFKRGLNGETYSLVGEYYAL